MMPISYINVSQLAYRWQVSRTTIWRWAHNGKIPQSVRLSAGVTRWRLDDIETFESTR